MPIDAQAFVRVDTNRHSVPTDHAGHVRTLVVDDRTVRVVNGKTLIAEHARSWGRRQVFEQAAHRVALVAERKAARDLKGRDLVIATHGRGIWIIDDLTPLRALSDAVVQQASAFLPTRRVQERMPASGGWVEGDASFVGDNPPDGMVITYYLRTRHTYGPLELEVFDAAGTLVDTVTPSKHRGINRVLWNMRVKGPRVTRAAQGKIARAMTPRPSAIEAAHRVVVQRELTNIALPRDCGERLAWDLASSSIIA